MIRKRSFIYFTLGFLGIFLVSCSHHPKNAKTNYHYLKAEKSLSDRGKSIYYYLVSQVEDIAGKEEFSNLYLDKSIQNHPILSRIYWSALLFRKYLCHSNQGFK